MFNLFASTLFETQVSTLRALEMIRLDCCPIP